MLDGEQRAMRVLAARIKHDLGKYVSFQARWLPENASPEMVAEAVRADLLSTRRGPSGEQDAVEVWSGFRPALVGEEAVDGFEVDLSGAPAFKRLDEGMGRLARHVGSLKAGREVDLDAARQDALEVAEACKGLLNWLSDTEWTWPIS